MFYGGLFISGIATVVNEMLLSDTDWKYLATWTYFVNSLLLHLRLSLYS